MTSRVSPVDIHSADVPRIGRWGFFCDRKMSDKAVSEMSQTPRSPESPFSITLLYAQTPQGSLSSVVNYIISSDVLVGLREFSSPSPSPVTYSQ